MTYNHECVDFINQKKYIQLYKYIKPYGTNGRFLSFTKVNGRFTMLNARFTMLNARALSDFPNSAVVFLMWRDLFSKVTHHNLAWRV